MSEHKYIQVWGAREHNLKNINLTLPRDRLIVFTGLSAYNTWRLWNFGQRAPWGRQHAIRGALSLYLDLVNLFRFLLRLMGERRG